MATAHTVLLASAPTLVCEQCTQEGAKYLACESGVPRAAVTERIRECENPLARGHFGQHAVDEVRGRVCHAPATAGWTQPPPFTRKRDKSIVAAGIAVNAQKTFGENPAGQVGA